MRMLLELLTLERQTGTVASTTARKKTKESHASGIDLPHLAAVGAVVLAKCPLGGVIVLLASQLLEGACKRQRGGAKKIEPSLVTEMVFVLLKGLWSGRRKADMPADCFHAGSGGQVPRRGDTKHAVHAQEELAEQGRSTSEQALPCRARAALSWSRLIGTG